MGRCHCQLGQGSQRPRLAALLSACGLPQHRPQRRVAGTGEPGGPADGSQAVPGAVLVDHRHGQGVQDVVSSGEIPEATAAWCFRPGLRLSG